MAESVQSKLWWAAPAAVVLLLTTLALLLGDGPEPAERVSSHSAARTGFRAAYLLLEELDLPVRRSRLAADGTIRWVLYPNKTKADDVKPLRNWLERGGILVLADDEDEFAFALGLPVRVRHGEAGSLGEVRVEATEPGQVLWERDGEALVTIHDRGLGQVWLVNRPELLTNENIDDGDNGITVVRLAETVLATADEWRPTIYFDEYYHGMRERPGVVDILLTPPMHWFTIAAVGFLGLLLWHTVPRFGAVRAVPPPRRRSKEEFLDAVASLLERNRDYPNAYETARDALLRDLEVELGLPTEHPLPELLAELRLRPGGERLAGTLVDARVPQSAAALVASLNLLQQARNEFWNGRNHP